MLPACGAVKVESNPIKVEGNITHTVTVNAAQLADFYKAYCSSKFSAQDEIDTCVTDSLVQFWEAINHSVTGEVTPSGGNP